MNERDIVCVAMTPDSAQVRIWRSALEAEGIECQVGDHLRYWIDNSPRTQADLWVHRANAHRAREILEHHSPDGSMRLEAVR